MPGKHRKPSRRRSKAVRRWAPSLAAAAVSATSLTTALTTGTTVTVSPAVQLTALITPANSTAQIFASSDFYGVNWVQQYGSPQVVPFFLGPQGIVSAIDGSTGDPRGIVVLSSGWAAGQTSTALAMMQADHDPALNDLTLVVLDNNTNRAGGGFWTTYWMFAPLLLTSAQPTPNNTGVPILDVAYEYNINSDAPTYPIDLFSDANALAAYLYGYGGQSTAQLPNVPGGLQPGTHYVVAPDGSYTTYPATGDITYVTFESNGLPLLRPLLLLPGGQILADAIAPTLTVLVNAGYQDNQPIPDDPGVTRPAGLLPPTTQTVAAIQQLPGAVQQGVQDGTAAAQTDLASPANLVTGPISEFTSTAGILTSSSPISLASTNATPSSASPFSITTGGSPGPNTSSSSAGGSGNPVEHFVGSVTSALGGLANSLTSGLKNAAGTHTGSH